MGEHDSPFWYDDQVSFMPDFDSPRQISHPYTSHHHQYYSCKQELELQHNMPPQNPNFLQLPQLESPNNGSMMQSSTQTQEEPIKQQGNIQQNIDSMDQLTDWRVLDKFVASQLSHEDATKEDIQNYSNSASFQVAEHMNMLLNGSERQDDGSEYASMSTPTCPIDLWKWKTYLIVEYWTYILMTGQIQSKNEKKSIRGSTRSLHKFCFLYPNALSYIESAFDRGHILETANFLSLSRLLYITALKW